MPTDEDHALITQWMRQNFGEGRVKWDLHVQETVTYQAERQVGGRAVSYTLQVTHDAFDDENAAETIVRTLEQLNVAAMLRANPEIHLRYYEGGHIKPVSNA